MVFTLKSDSLTLVLFSCRDRLWKIADFGITSEGSDSTEKYTFYARGTPGYRAPELLKGGMFTNKIDIWSVGCILYELVVGRKPFLSEAHVLHYSTLKDKLDVPAPNKYDAAFMRAITKAIQSTLNVTPASRPSADELVQVFSQDWNNDRTIALTISPKSSEGCNTHV